MKLEIPVPPYVLPRIRVCSKMNRKDARLQRMWLAAISLITLSRRPVWKLVAIVFLLANCSPPVQVDRVPARDVERQLDSNVISTGQLSEATRVVLHRADLAERFGADPDGAIASLHQVMLADPLNRDMLYALAELSFSRAATTGQGSHSLSAAVYAYSFLFSEGGPRPSAWGGPCPRPGGRRTRRRSTGRSSQSGRTC